MSLLVALLLPSVTKDDEGEHWVTVGGQHILIGADGNPKTGNVAQRIGMRLSYERNPIRRLAVEKSYHQLEKVQQVDRIPPNRASALSLSTGSGYRQINGGLRAGKEDECVPCPQIDKALRQASMPEDTEVFRGGTFSPAQVENFVPGAKFSDKGYVSTSLSVNTAKSFADQEGTPVIFSIQMPKGSQGLAVGSFSDTSEHEVLLPRGSKFEVTSASWGEHDGYSYKAVELKYLGAS